MLNPIFDFIRKCMRKKAYLSPLPIISVGNITLGGTGKTPLVYYLANSLLQYYDRIAILTRGYGKITNSAVGKQLGAKDDEDFTYRFKNIIRIVNRNRVEGVKKAIEKRCKLAILDDGFQYHNIRKNIEIVVINPFQKVFSSFIFPFGILRENIEAIKYADFVVLNHSQIINEKFKKKLYDKLRKYKKPVFNMSYKIAYLINAGTGEKIEIEKFENTNVTTFCAIGCPESFFSLLRHYKINILQNTTFKDHHNFTKKELSQLLNNHPIPVITTEKDFLRIHNHIITKTSNLFYTILEIEIENSFLNAIITQLKNRCLST